MNFPEEVSKEESATGNKKATKSKPASLADGTPVAPADTQNRAIPEMAIENEIRTIDPSTLETPYKDVVRPLSPDEKKYLHEELDKCGMTHPITISTDGKRVIDGHSRLDWAKTKGLSTVRAMVVTQADSPQEEWERAIVLNTARRQLTKEERDEVIQRMLKENPSASSRSIAEKAGASAGKVNSMRNKMERSGTIAPTTERKGKDGKTRPTKVGKKKSKVPDPGLQAPLTMPSAARVTHEPTSIAGGKTNPGIPEPEHGTGGSVSMPPKSSAPRTLASEPAGNVEPKVHEVFDGLFSHIRGCEVGVSSLGRALALADPEERAHAAKMTSDAVSRFQAMIVWLTKPQPQQPFQI